MHHQSPPPHDSTATRHHPPSTSPPATATCAITHKTTQRSDPLQPPLVPLTVNPSFQPQFNISLYSSTTKTHPHLRKPPPLNHFRSTLKPSPGAAKIITTTVRPRCLVHDILQVFVSFQYLHPNTIVVEMALKQGASCGQLKNTVRHCCGKCVVLVAAGFVLPVAWISWCCCKVRPILIDMRTAENCF